MPAFVSAPSTPARRPHRGDTHAADDLDNQNVRIDHMRAWTLVSHSHESREHGELETCVDGAHLGDVGRV